MSAHSTKAADGPVYGYFMPAGLGDPLWDAFVDAALSAGHAEERRSRFSDKPALFIANREIAHREAPGIIDLRITAAGWKQARNRYGDDPAVHREPARRDWIELHLASAADLSRLGDLVAIAIAANA